MTEVSIHWAELNVDTSIVFEGDGEVLVACDDASADLDNMDVDYEEDEDACGCGENQLSHYDYNGDILENLPERCRRNVNGPIGKGSPCTVIAVNWLTNVTQEPKNDDSATESETEINSSMRVDAGSTSQDPPPPNQQANALVEIKKPRERQLIQRVDDWAQKVAKVNNSRKSSQKRKIHVKILGDSQKVNIKVSGKAGK